MKRILPLALLAFVLAAPSARGVALDPGLFECRSAVMVSGYAGTSTLTNFPVLVTLAADSPAGFDYADCAAGGADLRFADADGNLVPHEIESWNTAGTSYVWVRVPRLAGRTTGLSLYYGADPATLPTVDPSDVWSRYVVAIHGGDSLANAVAGGPAVTAGSASVAANAAAGKVGGGVRKGDFNTVGVNAANVSPALASNGKFSVSAWFKRSSGSGKGNGTHVLASSRTGWNEGSGFLWLNEQDSHIAIAAPNSHQWNSGNGKLAEGVWAHVAFAYESGASLTSYFNGAQDNRKTSGLGNLANASGPWTFGSYANTASGDSFKGDMDEMRIFDGVASGDWIKAEYDSTSDPASFAVAGAVGSADPTAPVLDAPAIVRNADGTYTVTVVLSENGGAVGVVYDAGATAVTNIINVAATPGTYADTPANLADGTTYRVSAYGKGASGTEVVKKGGVLYNGSLSFGATTDADEATLAAGGVIVSRAASDPWPLAVTYMIAGSAGSAGSTWVAPAPVEIPAGSASATLPVVPLRDDDVNADIAITVALAAGDYGRPEPNAASLTLVNRHVVVPLDFAKKIVATPSAAVLAKIGDATWTDFPVLVRLPAEASALLRSADGTDLLVTDENDAALPFEVETFDPAGTTFVWVKVPTLSAATEITVHFGGAANADNDPTAVWSRYVGVWHFDADAAGTATVSDATGHALDGTTTGTMTAVEGPFGAPCLNSTATIAAPNYEPGFSVGATFTASGWFKAPEMTTADYVSPAKKKGSTWNTANGWYLEMPKDTEKLQIILTGNTPSTAVSDVRSNWHYFEVVSGGGTVKVYLDGDTSPKISSSYTIVANSEPYSIQHTKSYSDEYRLRKGAASAAETALEYATMADAAFFDYGAIADMDPTAPAIAVPVVARDTATGAFTVTALVLENVPTAVFCVADGITNAMATADAGLPTTYSATLSGLAADTTYACAVGAGSSGGTVTTKTCPTAFYTGDLSVAKVSDANENGLVPGVFRISRADTAHDLTVAYTVGGTAIAGQTYVALSGTATIPAGSNSVDIAVSPLIDAQTTSNTTVSVTLAAGLYGIDAQAGSAELTVVNLAAPSGYNTWIAPADGLASVGSNWSEGHAPTSSEAVLFDGRFSTKNCEWDAAASATVASWTQNANYTGTVQIDTTYDATFPALNVTGDVAILGGNWTHRINEAADGQKYHLKAIVGGDFTLASGCKLDAEMKGYWAQKYPAGSTYSAHAASGDGFDKIYGNVYRPADLGAGSYASGTAADNKSGGGAVWLEVGGAATLDGTINVRGRQFDGSNTACGSVYVKAKSCAGSGSILANFSAGSYYNGNRGAGGRVAIELTEATTLAFPTANVKINGINAGGSGGGGGTFYVKTADPDQPNGVLYLDDQRGKSYGARWHNPQAITAIPAGETWTFDAIVIRNYGMLAVPAGTTLNLPNGPLSISATSTRHGGIRYDGGTINWGSAPYEFASNWIFQANAPYTFDGNVIVHNGGVIGCLQFQGKTDFSNFTKCDITVNGDLTVESGGYLYANGGGPDMNINRDVVSFHGGQSAGASGNKAYDSIFAPRLPGYGTANGDQATSAPGGGLLLIDVRGAFVNNGTVTANGSKNDNAGSSGGSIVITARTLSGSGVFSADSASGSNGSGGGGRIAVRLTGGSFADGAETNFFARGATVVKDGASSDRSSSAGTVYLQDGGEGYGTIYVRNDGNALNVNTYTPLPAGVTKAGVAPDAAVAFKRAKLVVGDCGRVKPFADLRMDELFMTAGTALDLNGHVFTVTTAHVDGINVIPGTYTAAQLAARGFVGVVDTADGAGGTLRVLGSGTMLILR